MIIFEHLKYKNFLSSGNTFININLNEYDKVLLFGKNGSGKSIFMDAITFALFNKPFRKINIPQLVNSVNKKNMEVHLSFRISDVHYKVIRGKSPNLFVIEKNGDILHQDANIKDSQKNLEESILHMNYDSFCQIVILGSGNYTPFMQIPTNERRSIIEELLDIKIFSSMNQILKGRIIENDSQINNVQNQITLQKEKLRNTKRIIEMVQNNKNTNIDSIQNEIIKLQESLQEKKQEIDNNKGSLLNVQEFKEKKKDIQTKISSVDKSVYKLQDTQKKNNKNKTFFSSKDICPTCSQVITQEFKESKIQSIDELQRDVERGLKLCNDKLKTLSDDLKNVSVILEKQEDVSRELYRLNTDITTIERQIEENETKIKKSKEDHSTTLQKEQSNYTMYESSLQDSETVLCDLNQKKVNYKTVSTLLKDSGIKAQIISQYLPIMNRLVNKYLSQMDFNIEFSMNEEFKEMIRSRYKENFSYSSFSEGEKLRIDLAILFAWRSLAKIRNSISTNLLIIDEIFDSSLDASGIDDFMKIIDVLENTNTFIISHKTDLLQDKFEHSLEIKKIHGFTEVKEGS